MFYTILVKAHSGLRWVVLLLLITAIVTAYRNWQSRNDYSAADNRLYLFAFIGTHVQLLLGLILYFISPKVNWDLMADKLYRFYTVEHLVGMLIAIALITVGRVRSRKATDAVQKHRMVFVFYLTGLAVMLASIPWPFRVAGAGWY